jgi:hypothetical protein
MMATVYLTSPYVWVLSGVVNGGHSLKLENKVSAKYARAVWEVRGLVAVRRCYGELGGDFHAKL